MITEIVTFTLPEGMPPEEAAANFEKTAPSWRANPDLIRRNYLLDASNRIGGGVSLERKGSRCKVARTGVPEKGQRDLRLGAEEPAIRYPDRRR